MYGERNYKLTVLTEPVRDGHHYLTYKAKYFPKSVKNFLLKTDNRGPAAVARSLVAGLKKIGAEFNYNPTLLKDVGEAVVVLSNIYALKQAIQWKREGKIKRLLAGPNLVILPSDCKELITAEEIDVYLVNSNWTYEMYVNDAPELLGRCVVWPAGVDIDYWIPEANNFKNRQILIYQKTVPSDLVDKCQKLIESRGYHVIKIVYGRYNSFDYLQKLQASELMVFFSKSESQGIALAEAWAVNVPTLVWNKGNINYKGRVFAASSAPFLTGKTGFFFTDFITFESAFNQWEKMRDKFNTRQWVIENMSDQTSAKILYELCGV